MGSRRELVEPAPVRLGPVRSWEQGYAAAGSCAAADATRVNPSSPERARARGRARRRARGREPTLRSAGRFSAAGRASSSGGDRP